MSVKPKQRFTAQHIAAGVDEMVRLNAAARDVAPHATGPMARIPIEQPQQPEPEVQEGYCLGCKGKKKFEVEGEEKTKNGAIRKYGKCQGEGCGRSISTFVSGAKEGAAA